MCCGQEAFFCSFDVLVEIPFPVLFVRVESLFERPPEVDVCLQSAEFLGPLQYRTWRKMSSIFQPGIHTHRTSRHAHKNNYIFYFSWSSSQHFLQSSSQSLDPIWSKFVILQSHSRHYTMVPLEECTFKTKLSKATKSCEDFFVLSILRSVLCQPALCGGVGRHSFQNTDANTSWLGHKGCLIEHSHPVWEIQEFQDKGVSLQVSFPVFKVCKPCGVYLMGEIPGNGRGQ